MVRRDNIRSMVLFCVILTNLLVFTSPELLAQRRFRFFYGKVFDQVTKKPLPNVNFSVARSTVGTISDSKGEFSFYTDTIPAEMQVSHVGYITKKVILDTSTYSMTLYLRPEIRELKEIVISAKPQEVMFKDEHYSVLDYELDSGYIYLLIFRVHLSRTELICINSDGDTLARSGILPFSPEGVSKDCIGYLHVQSHDSVFQVFREGKNLFLIYPVKLDRYKKILGDCVAATESALFFKRVVKHGAGMEYYTINRKTKERVTITDFQDDEKARMMARNPEDVALLTSRKPDGNDALREWAWVNKILYRPIKAAMYRIGDFICIFNIPNKQIEFYDLDGNFSYKIRLHPETIREGRWTNDVFIDSQTMKLYTTFLKGGICFIYEIDLNNGEFNSMTAVDHPFPEKISVFDRYVYYLYVVPNTDENKVLFRKRM